MAEPAFYEAVKDRLNQCDSIIFEGVRSFRTRLLTMAYRIPAKRKSLGLVLQSTAIRRSDLRASLIHGDMSADDFGLAWAEIPWHQRIGILSLAPLAGIAMYLFATRGFIARGHTIDSLPAKSEVSSSQLEETIVHKRDRLLLARIESHIRENRDADLSTAILFGGGHMPGIASILMNEHGYRVTNSEWVTAIAA